jgi:hypothetical protein
MLTYEMVLQELPPPKTPRKGGGEEGVDGGEEEVDNQDAADASSKGKCTIVLFRLIDMLAAAFPQVTYADVCWHMLTYAGIC